jgi:hypothetical protein
MLVGCFGAVSMARLRVSMSLGRKIGAILIRRHIHHIVPVIKTWMCQNSGFQFMQDNASGHYGKETRRASK